MTISTLTSRNNYVGDGATTLFPYTFRLLDQTHLEVYVAGVLKALTTDYSVTGVGNSTGGNIVFVTAPASSAAVAILRVVPLNQLTDYVENDKFGAETHEAALDKLTQITQQLAEVDARAIKLPKTSTKTNIDLPEPVNGLELFRWNAAKTALELIASSSLAPGVLNPIVATGDLIRGSATAVPERLAIGSAGQVLTVSGGNAVWAAATGGITLTNKSGGTVNANDPVVLDEANDQAFTTSTTKGHVKPIGIARVTILNNAAGEVQLSGKTTVAVTGAVTRGNFLRHSASAKLAEDAGVSITFGEAPAGAFAVALTSAAGPGAGTVEAYLIGATSAGMAARAPECRLKFISTTSLRLDPYNGNTITLKSGGQWKRFRIPSAGVTISNGSLAASTLYYCYAYDNAGTITLELSTTAYSVDTDVGLAIKTADATRLLVGMIRTTSGVLFADDVTQRFVRSRYNDPELVAQKGFSADRTTASASIVEINTEIRTEFLVWAGEIVRGFIHMALSNNTNNAVNGNGVAYDGTTEELRSHGAGGTANVINISAYLRGKTGLAEGYHYITCVGLVSGGTGTWYATGSEVGVIIGGAA